MIRRTFLKLFGIGSVLPTENIPVGIEPTRPPQDAEDDDTKSSEKATRSGHMIVAGVLARKYITSGKHEFLRPLTTKSVTGLWKGAAQPIFGADGRPLMGKIDIEYYTFNGKHFRHYPKHRDDEPIPRKGMDFESMPIFKYLESVGLTIATNHRFNSIIQHDDVLGVSIGKRVDSLVQMLDIGELEPQVRVAAERLRAIGIHEEPALYCGHTWRAD